MAVPVPSPPRAAWHWRTRSLSPGILIAQLKRKGTPVISGGGILTLDMRSAISSYGAPEFMLTMAAVSELAEYYDLPAWGYAGCTDAKVFDEQAAADTAQWVMMAALSGSNLVHDVGFVESGMTSSLRAAGLRRRGDRQVRASARRHDR